MSPEGWTEVALRVRPEALEAVADLLQELTGRGVTIEPAIEALGPDEGFTLDESAPLRLLAYFEGPVSASGRGSLRRLLKDQELLAAVEGRLQWRSIREEDWAETWKEHYDIERVGRLVVRPAWREYKASRGEVVISLDPGMAFGTGQHATTRMCLEGLAALEQGTRNKEQGTRNKKGNRQQATSNREGIGDWGVCWTWGVGPGFWRSRRWLWARSGCWRPIRRRWLSRRRLRTRR